ncbi:MAG: hypothetical protein JSU02_07485, partial [Bacteroidetes bacterium]|nr:hypothetical protein [Bacteroidota bacterium]
TADCHGDFGGTAYTDNCGTCVGGNTGLNPCTADCHGDFGGTAYTDNCGTCVGGNTGLNPCTADCHGDWGGTAYTDNCGTCVGGNTGLNPCTADCHGDFGGTAYTDNCGTCVGGNTGLNPCVQDCHGDWGGTAYTDNCGTCVGGNTGLNPCTADCHGDFGGTAYTDNCGTCVGGNTGLTACVQDCEGTWGGSHTAGTPCDDGNASTQNDAYDANCICTGIPVGPCTGNYVVVNITTDSSPAGLGWQIHDGANALIASGAPTVPNSINSETVCVGPASACYTFNLYDSFGDGIAGGGWELRTTTGKLLLHDEFAVGATSPLTPTASASYGSGHSFCLPAGPTNIAATECGIFNNALGNKVYSNKVTGATQYQFEFSDPDVGFIRRIAVNRNYVAFNEMVANPLIPGVKYFARVRCNVSGPVANAHWGSGCEMGLGTVQVVNCSQLIQAPAYGHSCNETRTFNTNNSFIYAKPIVGATQYQFHIFNASEGYDQTFTRSTYILQLKWNGTVAPPLVNGSTYNVQVNVKVNGLYSGFCGNSCTITIDNGGSNATLQHMAQSSYGEATLWPNPVRDGQVNLSITGLLAGSPADDHAATADADQQISVDVQDIYGNEVFAKAYSNSGDCFRTILQLPGDIASGVYMVHITVNGVKSVQRLSIIR